MTQDPFDLGRVVGEALLGTSDYPEAYLQRNDMDPGLTENSDFCTSLDNTAMCCDCCGWYVEPCELDDASFCEDCR